MLEQEDWSSPWYGALWINKVSFFASLATMSLALTQGRKTALVSLCNSETHHARLARLKQQARSKTRPVNNLQGRHTVCGAEVLTASDTDTTQADGWYRYERYTSGNCLMVHQLHSGTVRIKTRFIIQWMPVKVAITLLGGNTLTVYNALIKF